MALQPHPRSAIPRSRVRGSPLLPLAGHQFLGPDDYPFAIEGRGTPRDTTEGLDQDTLSRSDHSDPYHTTLGLSSRVSEPKGGIDVLKESSSPDSVGERATPAGTPSAGLPAGSPSMEVSLEPEGFGLTVAAIRSFAVNSQQDARSTQQRYQSTEVGRTSDEAWGVQEPAQNLGVSPSPLLAAARQPPAPVPLLQSSTVAAARQPPVLASLATSATNQMCRAAAAKQRSSLAPSLPFSSPPLARAAAARQPPEAPPQPSTVAAERQPPSQTLAPTSPWSSPPLSPNFSRSPPPGSFHADSLLLAAPLLATGTAAGAAPAAEADDAFDAYSALAPPPLSRSTSQPTALASSGLFDSAAGLPSGSPFASSLFADDPATEHAAAGRTDNGAHASRSPGDGACRGGSAHASFSFPSLAPSPAVPPPGLEPAVSRDTVCRLVTRLSPLPLPRSTSCTTPLLELLQLVRPRRRHRRLLLCSR